MESTKPFEVELLVAEVLEASIELYHVRYDGFITDETGFVVIGGQADEITERLAERFEPELTLEDAVRRAYEALTSGESRPGSPTRLEVAGLDRTRGRRKFFRLTDERVAEVVGART
jgi:proteasome alpha subunit